MTAVKDGERELQNVLEDQRPKGEWVKLGVNNNRTFYKCSKCGFVVLVRDSETVNTTYPFCTCGADMRGGVR